MNGPHETLRALPSVAALLASEEGVALAAARSHAVAATVARAVLDAMRGELLGGALRGDRPALLDLARARLAREGARPPAGLRRVINATGVVLHTNLGRAPLGPAVLDEVRAASLGYADLEFDLAAGARGHRDATARSLLTAITGAEDALVVNNCAAAVLLACSALAAGREVLVSRGELVEIGGGFRIPEVIASCGATLREVGTTNRTYARDFERALGPATGAILRVHPSNFSVRGFTAAPALSELATLATARAVPLLVDLGSGALLDTRTLGLPSEPTAREALRDGATLVMFSGDKLLGGPQAGIVVGAASCVQTLRRHPLTRALRPGRLVLSALAAVLRRYAEGAAPRDAPALRVLAEPAAAVRARAEAAAEALGEGAIARVVPATARVGGGTLPDAEVPSWAIRIDGPSPDALEAALRADPTPVLARRADGALLVDLRTVADDELDALTGALRRALASARETEHAPAQRDSSYPRVEEEG